MGQNGDVLLVRRPIKNRDKEAGPVIHCDIDQPIWLDRPLFYVQMQQAIPTCTELLHCELLAQEVV